MKTSLNLVRQFTKLKLPNEELIERIGKQLGAVDEVIDWGARYEGIVVAKVITCEQHPNADKLHVCLLDDGKVTKGVKRNKNGYVEVVCGAPNIAAGQTVAWLPPGASVPATYDTEPLVLEAKELRGVVSNGMIGSSYELALNHDHSGILVLDDSLKAGTPFGSLYELDDTIIDIENKMFTHRPDCFGIMGVARELAGIQQLLFKSPDNYKSNVALPKPSENLAFKVKNEAGDLVPRFMAAGMVGVKVEKSPLWLQSYLTRLGVRPINNIVDVTNYVMLVTGQPLHAYDYDKLIKLDRSKSATLVSRRAKKGEKVRLLDGKGRELTEGTIVIATEKAVVGIGGVMGAENSEVDEDTKRIVIECANFDMYAIRRASMSHGIFTDAVTRFNKGQSPEQCQPVLARAVDLIREIGAGQLAGEIQDAYKNPPKHRSVKVTPDFINARLGLKLSVQEIVKLLTNVEFTVEHQSSNVELRIMPPFWRTDIAIPEDIVEEVGRLHGFDNLPLELPDRTLQATNRDELLSFKHELREILSRAGANELLTYSFIHADLMNKVGQDEAHAFKLSNALSPDLQYYRMSLAPSLLELVHPNIKAGWDMFALFEIGKAHVKGHMSESDVGVPEEEERLALVFAAEDKVATKQFPGAAYYQARAYLDHLLTTLGISYHIEVIDHQPRKVVGQQALAPFDQKRTAYIRAGDENGHHELVGFVGEPSQNAKGALKLPACTSMIELDVLQLLKYRTGSGYQPLSRFPSVEQDISLQVAESIRYHELTGSLRSAVDALLPNETSASLWPLDIFQKDKGHKNITYRVNVTSYERTLTADEVNALLDKAAKSPKLKAKRI